MMPEGFACCSLTQVNFDDGRFYSANGVMQSDRCMGKCSRVENNCTRIDVCVMQPVNQLAFMIGLPKDDVEPQVTRMCRASLFNLAQGECAVDFRLARAQKIEVRTIEDVNGSGHGLALHP